VIRKLDEESIKAIDRISQTFCASLSATAVGFTQNRDAAMNEGELAAIQGTLTATIADMTEDMRGKVSKYGNPVMLMANMGLYALRVSQLRPIKVKPSGTNPTNASAQPTAPTPENVVPPSTDPGHPSNSLLAKLGNNI
jgi:hypothetical protein